MVVVVNKCLVMMLFFGSIDIYSYQVCIVLVEKGVSFEIEYVEKDNLFQDLIDFNLNQSVLILVDCELILWEFCIIMEYLDECFLYLLLMFVYLVVCGESCLYMYCIEKDWYMLMNIIINGLVFEVDVVCK